MRLRTTAIALLVVTSVIGAAAAPAAAQNAEGEAYSGANVQFETTGSSVTDYSVNGETVVENVTVQSSSEAGSQSSFDLSAGLDAATDLQGAGLGIATQTSVGATVQIDSGAEMQAHDNQRGIFQVRASGGDQVVQAELAGDAQASSEGDQRVVVERDDGADGAFIVVGDGDVAVNEEGNVNAEVQQGSQLVYRQYSDGRDDGDAQAEQMIQNGTATAEVYVQGAAEGGEDASEDTEEATTHAVEYGQDTTVEITSQSQSELNMTVERSQSQGKVVLTTVSEEALGSAESLEVFVDGEAAAQADSYSAVEQSAQQGDQPRYYVAQSSSASATTDVAIGIDHFSERNVRMSGDGEGGDGVVGDGAGFGVVAVLAALASALVATRRR